MLFYPSGTLRFRPWRDRLTDSTELRARPRLCPTQWKSPSTEVGLLSPQPKRSSRFDGPGVATLTPVSGGDVGSTRRPLSVRVGRFDLTKRLERTLVKMLRLAATLATVGTAPARFEGDSHEPTSPRHTVCAASAFCQMVVGRTTAQRVTMQSAHERQRAPLRLFRITKERGNRFLGPCTHRQAS